jgi:branched-subunit amino acid transport protein AzlD
MKKIEEVLACRARVRVPEIIERKLFHWSSRKNLYYNNKVEEIEEVLVVVVVAVLVVVCYRSSNDEKVND